MPLFYPCMDRTSTTICPSVDRVIPYSSRVTERTVKKAEEGHTDPATSARIVGENLSALMEATKGSPNDLSSNPRLDAKVKLGTSALSRLRNAQGNPTLETLDVLAGAFKLQPWQFLVPGLDPANPPRLVRASESLKRAQDAVRALSDEERIALFAAIAQPGLPDHAVEERIPATKKKPEPLTGELKPRPKKIPATRKSA
jgi:transcriptional regulator with XRE-family HTH domain